MVVYGSEKVYAYHRVKDGQQVAITVDQNCEQVNVVFPESNPNRIFDYGDWMDLDYYVGNKANKYKIERCRACYFYSEKSNKCDSCDYGYPYAVSHHGEKSEDVNMCILFISKDIK